MYRDPATGHPLLVVAFNGKVFALDRVTGKVKWRVEVSEFSTSVVELVIDETTVIACTKTHLAFIDYPTGDVKNLIPRADDAALYRPLLIVDHGQLFIAGSGTAACYSLQGELLWQNGFRGEGYGDASLGFPHRVRQADLSA